MMGDFLCAAALARAREGTSGRGGPADWALPYWNYSEDLSKNPKARLMLPDFFERTIDGKPNALFSRRSQASNGDFGLDASVVTLKANPCEVTPRAT